jgi:mRNA deadenylase 3'-5' endonuclease subunit Ccr4
MTYTALTQRPIQYTPYQQNELKESVSYDFRQVKDEEEEISEDVDGTPAGSMTPAKNTIIDPSGRKLIHESSERPVWKTPEYLKQLLHVAEEKPLNITQASLENNELVLAHHLSNPALRSLYSTGLPLCQPDNAVNAFGEPPFTNWAHGYKETLDYIFVADREKCGVNSVRLMGVLSMPRRDEMGDGEPQEGRFPSDHVCEMVEVEIS